MDGHAGTDVSGIAYRSDAVRPGDVFFCIPGHRHDGHDFAADALSRGAVAIVCERPLGTAAWEIVVDDARRALALASAAFHDHPSGRMDVVGITGTNGKTTTTYIMDSILRQAGRTTGLIGTVETRVAGERQSSSRTTPESADLQALLARMVEAGVEAVSMEVSSHAIDLHRVDALRFAVAAFTNLTQDHLDYHRTLDEYWSVKRRLFTDLEVGARVVNIDDPRGAGLGAALDDVWTVGRAAGAMVRAENERPAADSTTFHLVTPEGEAEVTLPLAGAYNVSNALVAAGSALAMGIGLDIVVRGLESAPQVPGRLEGIDEGQPFVVLVDYAHTPDSLAKAIAAVRDITPGRVITVFGCGGDRDPEKRPLMGKAAGENSDIAVVTSDNPRSEDPVGIILRTEDGLKGTPCEYEVEVDRRTAIARAFAIAREGDAVLIAGKGHEDYQIFADRTIHFDDREVAREELRARC
ncbi:UDP-N-acetylmuramoyl-L-alanyl-D-glutamate--2,6-diaminopimelate ligase [Anaerosoma tenue]|uniref:UDP-N-acetylmuramoyl-L-alanyl-D-glutamate--2, 6-diaminopimelate ligase n=1 Tax=Anaerosoma tenue TaxID=2933588 RepID=UPI00226083D8|nr:UDP-N-acetylmuramoyl-L-alanyl-D-glutamate--2,6-diaminopimelate ligase [Anaerosoma tenue]MCK8114372.1 UDP-N-acetylmuramoyl-L-alanyl-D-glutamate--2,6-diaminopimelate ligase [Anaerosoma tenue]